MNSRLLKSVVTGALFALALCSSSTCRAAAVKYFEESFPFQGACITAQGPGKNVAMKGFAIRVGTNANMLWDTDLLRFASGWKGGYITGRGVAFDGGHGNHPSIVGTQLFGTKQGPGWANANGEFVDTRPEPFGPLAAEWCRWDGLYVNGMDVGLAYTVLGAKIVEQPSMVTSEGRVGFVRTFKVEGVERPLRALIADLDNGSLNQTSRGATLSAGSNAVVAQLVGAPEGVKLSGAGRDRIVLDIPKGAQGTFSVVIWGGPVADAGKVESLASSVKPRLADFARGGVARWTQAVSVKGALNTSQTPDGAYVTDAITSPVPNPWNRRVRFGGMDFFSDGTRAALCTHEGDVWIVEGIDDKLENLKWRRFASGQYETLGLAIVDDVIYTSGRDQITRYHDLNKDGEADFYENFNNEVMSTEGFHEFVFDLQTDRDGNFYFAKANPVNSGGGGFGNQKASMGNGTVCSHSGCLFKVSKDGKKFEVIARGFRAPNGIGVSQDGQVTTSDNEGTWVPTTPINWVEPGGFHGVINDQIAKDVADKFIPPLAWLSKDYDNSGGGQIWVTSSKWGPFQGELLHESYGKSSLFLVMKEKASNGRMQGGVVRFPLKFTSSVMRARFNEQDGQLYVAGLSEWQSNASKPTGFDRVRYTGKPVHSVRGLKVLKDGVQLTFTEPLDKATVLDTQNWSGKRWNYARSQNYGSSEYSLVTPATGKPKTGRDVLDIKGATLSPDGKVVTLAIADFKPAMSETIRFNLKAADGTAISQEIQHTVHAVP
jgi:glucose/arabinose dehydrogenase